MKLRLFTILLAGCLLAGCPKGERNNKAKKPDKTKDQSRDVTFQSFVGQLRIAVARRDREVLSSMMSANFGYRWDKAPAGDDPFIYWDKNNLWGELNSLMSERWVPHEGFMVVPMQLATNQQYQGYRAGVQQENGSWRFSYFVAAPPAEETHIAPNVEGLPPL